MVRSKIEAAVQQQIVFLRLTQRKPGAQRTKRRAKRARVKTQNGRLVLDEGPELFHDLPDDDELQHPLHVALTSLPAICGTAI